MRFATISTVTVAAAFCAATAFAGQHGHAAAPPMHAPHPAPTPHTTAAAPPHGHAGTHPTPPPKPGSAKPAHPGTTTNPRTTATSSPIADKIESHPQLASRLTALLPPGTTLQQAAAGFRNQGQFIAALHVSHNLGIPFADLKREIVTNHDSLGQAIHKLRPGVDAKAGAKQGETEAKRDRKADRRHDDRDDKKGR